MNNHITLNDIGAGFTSFLSMFSASFAMITLDGVHNILSIIGSVIAIISGFLSAKYFYKKSKSL